MKEWIVLLTGLVSIGVVIAKYFYDKYKAKPKKPRVSYIEKELLKAKRKMEEYAARDNLFDLSSDASDLVDRVRTLNELEDSKRRKNTGKTGKDK